MSQKKSPKAKPTKTTGMHSNSNLRHLAWASLSIFAFCFVLYGSTLDHEYALDDKAIITLNKLTKNGIESIPTLATTTYWYGLNEKTEGVYRPLSPIAFAIEIELFGVNPKVSHFFNILWYGLCCSLLFLLMFRLFQLVESELTHWIPLIITFIFITHPLHTEVVANVKSRDELMALSFILLSAILFIRYLKRAQWKLLAMSLGAYFLGMLSKESALFFAGMIPLLCLLFSKKKLWMKSFLLYGATAAVYLLLYFSLTEFVPADGLHIFDNALNAKASAIDLFATKIKILASYLLLLVYPKNLVYDYSYNMIPITSFSEIAVWIGLVIYLAILVYALWSVVRLWNSKGKIELHSLGAFVSFWFLGSLLIVSNIFFLIGSTMAERFVFVPSLAWCMFLGIVIFKFIPSLATVQNPVKLFGQPLLYLPLVLIGLYSFKTIDRNPDWKNDETLFEADIEKLANNAKAHHNLSDVYKSRAENTSDENERRQLYTKAITELEKGIAIYPNVIEFQNSIGYLYGAVGSFENAIEAYQAAALLDPNRSNTYVQIAKAAGFVKRYDLAVNSMNKAVSLEPQNPEILKLFGIICGMSQRVDSSILFLERTLEITPNDKEAQTNLAISYQNKGDMEKASYWANKAKE